MSLLSRLVLRVLTGGGVFVSISMVDKNAGVIVATPGWALLGCTSRQAHRGQAGCLGDPVSPVLPLGGGRPRLLKSGFAMLNELYISLAFIVKSTIRLMFSGLAGRKNRLEAAWVGREGRG